MNQHILIVVAALDEADRISSTLAALAAAFPGAPVWVADDGSTDATPELARAAGAKVVRSERVIGKGQAMTVGVRAALASIDYFGVNARARVNADFEHSSPEPSVRSSDRSVRSPDPAVRSSDPSVRSSDRSVRSPDPAVRSSDPSVRSSDRSVRSPDPAVRSSDPSVRSSDPSVRSSDPSVQSSDPSVRVLAEEEPETFLVLCDGDLGDSARELSKLVDALRGEQDAGLAVAAFATRVGGGFGLARTFARFAIRRRCGLSTRAPISGQRALRAGVARDVLPFAPGFGMEIGMTIDAVRAGHRVVEVDLDLAHRASGRTLPGFLHRARQLADFVRVYFAGRARPGRSV